MPAAPDDIDINTVIAYFFIKDFIAVMRLTQRMVTDPELPAEFARICRDGAGFVEYLCTAVGVPF